MFKSLLTLMAVGLALHPAIVADPSDEGIEFDLDAHMDLPSGSVDLAKRVLGGSLPHHMYPFIAVLANDQSWGAASTLLGTASVPTETVERVEKTYSTYSHPYCAGAVLSSSWVLTSAYCINQIKAGEGLSALNIYANRKNLRPTRREAWIKFQLEDSTTPDNSVFINKFYDAGATDNDIALLKVVPYTCKTSNGAESCTKIKKLNSKRYEFPRISKGDPNSSWTALEGQTMWTGGWGLTQPEFKEYEKYNSADAFYLMRNAPSYNVIRTLSIPRADCQAGTGVPMNVTNVCTRSDPQVDNNLGGSTTTPDYASLCYWDYGAPLFNMKINATTNLPEWYGNRGNYNAKLIGIFSNFIPNPLSTGDNVCQNAFMVYSYLPAYCDWIREVTNEDIKCTEDEVIGG